MATRQAAFERRVSSDGSSVLVTWTGLLQSSSDDGAAVGLSAWGSRTFQVTGTLGAAGAVTLEGSNDGVTWATLADKQGVPLVVATLGLKSTQDITVFVRPRITAGDGTTNLNVSVCLRRDSLPENQP
jgi:hypothetical protein